MTNDSISLFGLEKQISEMKKLFVQCFDKCLSESYFVNGQNCNEFNKEFAQFIGQGYGVGVGSGLSALELSLEVLGIGVGDEVLVPHHTFIATWLAVSRVGAVPVGVDVDANGLIDIQKIKGHITNKTKAVICVHLYGKMVDVKCLRKVIGENILLIEDAAQSHEAYLPDQRLGEYSELTAFSFYPTKTLGCMGDGGFVYSLKENYVDRVKLLANYGSKVKYYHEELGGNSRLDEIQAAILREKLIYVSQWVEKRRQNARLLWDSCKEKGLEVCFDEANIKYHAFHLFVVKSNDRENVIKHFAQNGIETGVHYPCLPVRQSAYNDTSFNHGSSSVSKQLSETVLSIPCHQFLSNNELSRISDAILNI